MRPIKICLLLTLLVVAGCATNGNTKKTNAKFFELPAVIVSTTKGDIHIVVVPATLKPGFREDHIKYFLNCVKNNTFSGAAIKPASGPRGYKFYDCVEFYNRALKGKAIRTQKVSNVVPCRGTLYLQQISGSEGGIPAEAWRFIILKRNSREKGCKQDILLPSAGRVACIGQVTRGLEILDKLTEKDIVNSIKPAPDYKVNAKKYAMYGAGRIDNFADILKTE